MGAGRMLVEVARADFLERTRRPGYLLTLAVAVWVAAVYLPPNHARYVTLEIDSHRGLYNSAYVGTLIAMLTTLFLSLIGFYLVKNSVDRDRRTAVGSILAGTPLTKNRYAAGKVLSNLGVLASIALATVAAAAVMQLVRGEDMRIHPWALLSPTVLITLPVLAVVSALALLFEMIPWLAGGFGNAVFFFLWMMLLTSSSLSSGSHAPFRDVIGEAVVQPEIYRAYRQSGPAHPVPYGHSSMGFSVKNRGDTWNLTLFRFDGVRWRGGALVSRLVWLVLALALTALAARLFDRFDSAPRVRVRVARPPPGARAKNAVDAAPPSTAPATAAAVSAGSLAAVRPGFSFGVMLMAELRLLGKGVSRWWWLIALGLAIANVFAPLGVARAVLLPIAWIWPLLLWSAAGTRESRHGTGPVLFSSPQPLLRQLPAIWLAGAVVAVAIGGGVGVRFLLAGHGAAFATWFAGALFIPALALGLGVWSGSGKFFEVLYLTLWYIGPLNHVPALDYMASTDAGVRAGAGVTFALATMAMLVAAVIGRRKQCVT